MQAITNISTSTQSPAMTASLGMAGAAPAAAGVTAAPGAAATSQVTSVYNNVSMMLGQVDPSLAGNELAKMMIAMMLMTMLDKKQETQRGHMTDLMGAAMLSQASAALVAGGTSRMNLQTLTTSITVGQPVSASYVQQSYQAAAGAAPAMSLNATA